MMAVRYTQKDRRKAQGVQVILAARASTIGHHLRIYPPKKTEPHHPQQPVISHTFLFSLIPISCFRKAFVSADWRRESRDI